MLALFKAMGMLAAGIIATGAIVFAIASTMSLCSTDRLERRDATISAFWSLVIFALCAAAILSLSGCMSYEGAGFTNSGRPRGFTDCVRKDARGHEIWFSVPAGRACPR